MRAAIYRKGSLVVDTLPDPRPEAGQVVVKTLSCGICGSDLHALHHAMHMVDVSRRSGQGTVFDAERDVVFGHEFCAEVLDFGPDTEKRFKSGARVCSVPVVLGAQGVGTVGYSNEYPGGYGEQMVLNEALLLEVPNGLSSSNAALTEPMAVGLHAVVKAGLGEDDVPLVIGCGPVGLAVIATLKLKGAAPVVAADFSPARRRLAEIMGADIVIDPGETSPYTRWEAAASPEDPNIPPVLTLTGFRPALRPAVIFECVGVPGMLQQIMEGAPKDARVVVVGVCMEHDSIEPFFAIGKELNMQFVLGYTPEEFAETLHHVAEGNIDVSPMITGKTGLEGVSQAFDALANPDNHAKILVEPWSKESLSSL
ncbi:MAG: zinc-binding dehydrogenase [Parvularculales bacterium]